MISLEQARAFAEDWVNAWNRRDLSAILSHYAEDFEMSSPFIAMMAGEPTGTLRGKGAVEAYWQRALERIPEIDFQLRDVLAGVDSVVIYYQAVLGKTGAEVFFFDQNGKVSKAIAHYDG